VAGTCSASRFNSRLVGSGYPGGDCYTRPMADGRNVPLFDAVASPSSWNQRMVQGEYAVHYSSFGPDHAGNPFCTIFPTLQAAEIYANDVTLQRPEVRCQIYDHHGMVGAPAREICGAKFKGETDLGRFRRWGGGILFIGGAVLTTADWVADFRFGWPAMIGTRILLPGLILLVTEGLVMLHARQTAARQGTHSAA
jgi:hypothetical protein